MRIPALGIVFLFVFSILIDIYLAFDVRGISRRKWVYRGYWISSVLCWAFLIVTISLPRREESSDILTVMWMLYSYLTVYAAKLFYVLSSIFGHILRLSLGIFQNSHPFKWFGLIGGLALCGVMWLGAGYTRRHLKVEEVTISSPRLPKAFDGYRIAQISDLHVGSWGTDTTFVSRLVDSVNNLNPDLIVFTGDLVNRKTAEVDAYLAPLSRLRAKDGIFSILGNHDYGDYTDWKTPKDREDNNRLLAFHQRGMGWVLLNNQRHFIKKDNDSIMVIGVENWGDPPFPTYGDLNTAIPYSRDSLHHQNDNNFKILLSHNPAHWDEEVSKNTNIDLTLSGHTHAMQIMLRLGNLKWSPSVFRYKHWGGLYEEEIPGGDKSRLYVNIGAGEVGMPARLLGAYPEITLITLKQENQSDKGKSANKK